MRAKQELNIYFFPHHILPPDYLEKGGTKGHILINHCINHSWSYFLLFAWIFVLKNWCQITINCWFFVLLKPAFIAVTRACGNIDQTSNYVHKEKNLWHKSWVTHHCDQMTYWLASFPPLLSNPFLINVGVEYHFEMLPLQALDYPALYLPVKYLGEPPWSADSRIILFFNCLIAFWV